MRILKIVTANHTEIFVTHMQVYTAPLLTIGVFCDRFLCTKDLLCFLRGDRGSQVVKVLCYNAEGRWFDPSWCYWIFFISDRTMALESTQHVTEMSTRSISWG